MASGASMPARPRCGRTRLLPLFAVFAGACGGEPAGPAVQADVVDPLPSVGGEAYGLRATGPRVALGPVPRVVLGLGGGYEEAASAGVRSRRLLKTGPMVVTATGTIDSAGSTARTVARVEGVNLFHGRIRATRAVAVAGSRTDGITATSSAEGSRIFGLVIDGAFYGDLLPAPNRTIPLKGGGFVVLNEQTGGGDGVRASSLRVNLIRAVSGGKEVVVGSVASRVHPVLIIIEDPFINDPFVSVP
jgi:hypothetical protein